MTDHLLLEYRIQHTLHSSFYIFDGLVDDLVQTYIYFLTLCNGFCSCIRTYIETNDDGIGSRSQGNVRLIDSTNAAVDYLYYYLFIRQLGQALLYCFYRPLNVCLDDQRKFLYISCLDLAEQIIQRQFCLSIFQKLVLALRNEGFCKASCFFLILSCYEYLTSLRNII